MGLEEKDMGGPGESEGLYARVFGDNPRCDHKHDGPCLSLADSLTAGILMGGEVDLLKRFVVNILHDNASDPKAPGVSTAEMLVNMDLLRNALVGAHVLVDVINQTLASVALILRLGLDPQQATDAIEGKGKLTMLDEGMLDALYKGTDIEEELAKLFDGEGKG